MDAAPQYHGSLVAFEGPHDVVSTQIQLLPLSSQMLILPGIQHFGAESLDGNGFDVHALVRRVLEALRRRNKAATDFLRCSTPESKRLAFLCGGTAGAVAECIGAISLHKTGGDLAEAESIFRSVVSALAEAPASHGARSQDAGKKVKTPGADAFIFEDPTARAMRAADALDRETAGLQPDAFFRYSDSPRARSFRPSRSGSDYAHGPASLPATAQKDAVSQEKETSVAGPKDRCFPLKSTGAETARNYFSHERRAERDRRGEPSPPASSGSKEEPRRTRASLPEKTRVPISPVLSPRSATYPSPPATPDGVEYGEATVIQLRTPVAHQPVRRARSLDRLPGGRDGPLTRSGCAPALPEGQAKEPARPLSTLGSRRGWTTPLEVSTVSPAQQPRLVRAQQTTIRRSHTVASRPKPPLRPHYVDRGTNTSDESTLGPGHKASSEGAAFRRLCPVEEDLVIHFIDESPCPVLDLAIQVLKDGMYPIVATSSSTTHLDDEDVFTAANSPLQMSIQQHARLDGFSSASRLSLGSQNLFRLDSTARGITTPSEASARSPRGLPPSGSPSQYRLHSLSVIDLAAPLAIQSALRSLLSVYFPLKHGYRKYSLPIMPDRPLIRNPRGSWQSTSSGDAEPELELDHIVAVGHDPDISPTFADHVVTRIANLGVSRDGTCRSMRVTVDFIKGLGMQVWTSRPYLDQLHANPMREPELLAKLAALGLEDYLEGRKVRLLVVEYGAADHALVAALRGLYGAGRLTVLGLTARSRLSPADAFHDADALLPLWGGLGMAREAVEGIWRLLAAKSLFYVPESQPADGADYPFPDPGPVPSIPEEDEEDEDGRPAPPGRASSEYDRPRAPTPLSTPRCSFPEHSPAEDEPCGSEGGGRGGSPARAPAGERPGREGTPRRAAPPLFPASSSAPPPAPGSSSPLPAEHRRPARAGERPLLALLGPPTAAGGGTSRSSSCVSAGSSDAEYDDAFIGDRSAAAASSSFAAGAPAASAGAGADADTSASITELQPDMRRLIPQYLQPVAQPRRRQSRKALRLLGLD